MKHCPNPECGGLAKFKIVSEFNDSATICSDCQTPLVPGPAPSPRELGDRPEPDPDLELVPILVVKDEAKLILLESVLEEAEIPYLAKGEHIQDLFGFGRLVAVNPITGPVVIYVTSDKAAQARKLVADFFD
jgi:hypothetical protein